MNKQEIKALEKLFKNFFKNIGIVTTFKIEEKEEGVGLFLETEEAGLVIGRHGDTLEAMEQILSLATVKLLGKFVRVEIEIGEYKKEREEYLKNLAEQIKKQVLATSEAVPFLDLKAWERKYIHTYFQDDAEVTTKSEGEGRDRVLNVLPR